ncbi:MAG: fibronectin type III domain-containing protein, partial [Kiritimatiellae bacterium]|nr:fibronectin type III domain-containing protein [Kiritimatiellia bacterium]
WLLVDRVQYNDNSPWPEGADGDGPSLERIAAALYGNDTANWAASAEAGGTPGLPNSGVLVSTRGGWTFWDRGAGIDSAWNQPAFDDRSWADGNAPLGYPETSPALDTLVSYGDDPANKHVTTCFRTRFALGCSPGDVSALTLRIRYDDGYVAYLNGQEVARGGMPAGAVSYGTLATTANGSQGLYEQRDLTAHTSKLVQGVNTLAVEIHQVDSGSSDIFMDLELAHQAHEPLDPPAQPSNLAAAAQSTSRIQVTWTDNSQNETQFKIRWGTSATAMDNQVFPAANTTSWTHSGLSASTTYYYKIRSENAAGVSAYTTPVNATTLADLETFTAYNDLAWFSGQTSGNITTYTTTNGFSAGVDSGLLIDHATGQPLPVRLRVAGGSGVMESQGLPPAAGTDAYGVFAGKVDATGTISYGTDDLTLTFTGLDPALRYEVVVYCDRNESRYVGGSSRYHYGTLLGAASFENASTAGATVLTYAVPNDTTFYNAGYNNPATAGYATRFRRIDPGADGEVVLRLKRDAGLGYYSYANALMLRAAAPGVTEPAPAWVIGYFGDTNAPGAGPEDDPDADGMPNWAEYVCGTDPTNEAAYFAVNLGLNSGTVLVSFPTLEAAGSDYEGLARHYALEACSGLSAPTEWQAVTGYADVLGQGQTVVHTNPAPAGSTCYRAKVWLE